MTRDQLSDLANRLEDIVARLSAKEMGMGDFFSSVQAQSGQAAVDPEFGSFLPAYLDELPYGSKFINLTPSLWDGLGQQGQRELLDEVQAKVCVLSDASTRRRMAGFRSTGATSATRCTPCRCGICHDVVRRNDARS